ncbi:MAG: transketolase C-terminal domain-containing protein [Eubacteriales bacterium]|nr:transketolase C-terminal domain-containing protein [Eubacteriales bacterium]
MFKINAENTQSWNIQFRPMFGELVRNLVKERNDVILVVADSGRACRCDGFEECPNQFIDCGIAEQNMVGVAAGLAHCGKKPITFGFAPFASERGFEQIRIDVAYSNLNVIIVGSEGGVGMGTQGVTHFGWEDVAVMRSLPNMTVLCPADHAELIKCLEASLNLNGPVYIRMNGGIPKPVYREDYDFKVGKGILHKKGKDINIIATGPLVSKALEAADILDAEGIFAGVVDMHTIKPLDEKLIFELAGEARLMLTIEEHSVVNGLGTAVADVLSTSGSGCRLIKMGFPDQYPHTVSPYDVMMSDYGLTAENLVVTIKEGLGR